MTIVWKHVLVVFLFVSVLAAEESPFHSRELRVAPSPSTSSEVILPSGSTVVDYDIWPTGPDALIVLRDASGDHVVTWHLGDAKTVPLLDLPSGFDARSIAVHPLEKRFFISGKSGQQWRILVVENLSGKWVQHTIYQSPRELQRLLVAPRPFEISGDVDQKSVESYRIFFAARQPDGEYSTRSITEDGKREYQVVGPAASYVSLAGDNEGPAQNFTASAFPVAFHPGGDILIWQDAKGCFQKLPYDIWNWDKPSPIVGNPCGGSLTVTPNGTTLLQWKRGEPGITVIGDHGHSIAKQAKDYLFIATPSSTPDGKGIVGLVTRADGQALAYVPIDVPLADVINAWMFNENSEDQQKFVKNAGILRLIDDDQLYQLYDSEWYMEHSYNSATLQSPYFVTTDLFWDVFASAYEGIFMVQEHQQAMPLFLAFVTAARQSLQARAPDSPWALAFDAVAQSRLTNPTSAEAVHIKAAEGYFDSPALGPGFDFTELRPRGHYTATPEMQAYFKAVHYLTTLAATKTGAEPLNSLPADVQAKAIQWIASYQGFIAPSRAPLVWSREPFSPPDYALHPGGSLQIFPLSWGFDNEVLLSTVYHPGWPPTEQIINPDGARRLLPSGLDLAAALGSGYALSLLKTDLAEYPRLGPALDALERRRPKSGTAKNLYDAWIDALAVQWAGNVVFPGVADDSLWKTKRLQTGLASWATLRHATVLVNERGASEAGEGGFESIVMRPPRGYVEPDPNTFRVIASLFDEMAQAVAGLANLQGDLPEEDNPNSEPLKSGVIGRLQASAKKARLFASIADKELRNQELSDSDYEEILYVGAAVEHDELVFKSLGDMDLALSNPDPMMKIADVAGGNPPVPYLEAAVGRPLEWEQAVPYFGRREIVKGSVYSYYEFTSPKPLNDLEWAGERDSELKVEGGAVDLQQRPAWVERFISKEQLSSKAPF